MVEPWMKQFSTSFPMFCDSKVLPELVMMQSCGSYTSRLNISEHDD
jgi:hypothetical protein